MTREFEQYPLQELENVAEESQKGTDVVSNGSCMGATKKDINEVH